MITKKSIYLDYAAATPLDERVFAAMKPYMTDLFYNPSGAYTPARNVKQNLNDAKARLAKVVGGKPQEIIMTSGATESVNLAIQGVLKRHPEGQVVTTAIEHPAVLSTVKKFDYQICDVSDKGMINLDSLRTAISDSTVLVSVGYANNELGTVQPLKQIAAVLGEIRQDRLRRNITTPLYFHSDASQAAGHLDLNVSRLGVDLLTLNAAKCSGPKQTGLLWIRRGIILEPLLYGGGQEGGMRSGTESVANTVGFATALEMAEHRRKNENRRLTDLRSLFVNELLNQLPQTVVNGHPKRSLPNFIHVAWDGIDGERLVYSLDNKGIYVATGSACAANKGTRSHVLEAVGMNASLADGSLRITTGYATSEDDIRQAVSAIVDSVRKELA